VPAEELDERIDMAGQFIDRGQQALGTRQRRPAPQPIFPGRAALAGGPTTRDGQEKEKGTGSRVTAA
jgi:hypothetical protein